MSKFGENVKDAAWGAQGTDSGDDRSYIQAALDYCESVNGGMVVIPRGIYRIGKHPTQDYGLRIPSRVRVYGLGWGVTVLKQYGDAASTTFPLIQIDNGAEFVELENFTLDQSGLSNPLTDACELIRVDDATVLKFLRLQFKNGVANAGSYLRFRGDAETVWMDGLELREAGGTPIHVTGGLDTFWLNMSRIVQSGEDDTILLNAVDGDIVDGKIMNCRITASQKYGVRVAGTESRTGLQFADNKIEGFVSLTGMDHSDWSSDVTASASGVSEAVFEATDCTSCLFVDSRLKRASTCDDGYVALIDTPSRAGVRRITWIQETSGGLLHVVDPTDFCMSGNNAEVTDAGTGNDAYLIEAVAVTSTFQIVGDNISADAGTWDYAVHVKSNTGSFGDIQVNLGRAGDCDIGAYLDGALAKFTGKNMIAGGSIDADTAAWDVSDSAVAVNIGSNASTFGPQWFGYKQDPAGNLTARQGSICSRVDDASGAGQVNVKESGTGTSGWDPKP